MAGPDRTDLSDAPGLAAFFDAARAGGADPSPELLGRVLQDALDQQDRQAVARAAARPGARDARAPGSALARNPTLAAPRWRELLALLGGWPGLGGLAAAGLVGVWIGYALPGDLAGDGFGLGLFQPAAGDLDAFLTADAILFLTAEDF